MKTLLSAARQPHLLSKQPQSAIELDRRPTAYRVIILHTEQDRRVGLISRPPPYRPRPPPYRRHPQTASTKQTLRAVPIDRRYGRPAAKSAGRARRGQKCQPRSPEPPRDTHPMRHEALAVTGLNESRASAVGVRC